MIVFICIPWFAPAYKAGGPIQSISNLIDQFSENISYRIFCSNMDMDQTVLQVQTNKWIKYSENTQIFYASRNKLSVNLITREIKNAQPDILFINGIYSWYFNLVPLLFCKAPKKIISTRGMLHPGALSQKTLKKNIYLNLWKFFGLHTQCSFHASNEQEKEYIENVFGKGIKTFVAQNYPRVFRKQEPRQKEIGSLSLVSVALISPMKNYLLVLQALQYCQERIEYNIYGPVKDKDYWTSCLEQVNNLPSNIVVNYHGDISPDKIEQALLNADVFILPSKSENFGHAIFEALTAGKPVITSNNTPWNDLNSMKAGINVDPGKREDLMNAIKHFAAMSPEEFSQWNKCANEYAARAIDFDHIKEQYQNMFFGDKVVFISIPWFFPAYRAGGPIQSISNLIEEYSDNISYKIFCSNLDLNKQKIDVETDKWLKYNANTDIWYASDKKLRFGQVVGVIRDQIRATHADILFINGIYSWYFNLVPLLFCSVPKKILSSRGMLQSGALKTKRFKKKLLIYFLKIFRVLKNINWHATNKEEENDIKKLFGKSSKVIVATNIPKKPLQDISIPIKTPGNLKLIYLSLVTEKKNLLFLLRLIKATENISLDIYGPIKDNTYWTECYKLLNQMPQKAKYHGDVLPLEVQNTFSKYHASVLLTKGENFGHALYESLSAGRPVITSYFTPWNQLERHKAGWNLDISNFTQCITELNKIKQLDQQEFSICCASAYKLAKEYFTSSNNLDGYKKLFLYQNQDT